MSTGNEVSVIFKPHDELSHKLKEGLSELSIPGSSDKNNLDTLLNKTLLEESTAEENESSIINFTYIIGQQLFNCENLSQHILSHNLNTENAIEIIFFLKVDQPKPRLAYPHDDWVSSIDINDHFILSSTFEGTVHLWSLEDHESTKSSQASEKLQKFVANKANVSKDLNFKAHSQSVKCVKFLKNQQHDNSFITTSSDQTCILWNLLDKKLKDSSSKMYKVTPVFKLKGHTEQVEAAACSQSHIVTASADRMIKLWDASLEDDLLNNTESGIDGEPEPKILKSDQNEKVTKGKARNPILTISGHTAIITDCLFENHGQNLKTNDTVITASLDHSLRLWDIEIAKQKERLQTAKAILSVDENSDSTFLATGSTDRHVRIYDTKNLTKSVINNLSFHQGWVSSVKFNPSNKYQMMSTSYDKEAVLWDIRSSKEPLYALEAHKDRIYCSAWGSNGILATGGADSSMATWSV